MEPNRNPGLTPSPIAYKPKRRLFPRIFWTLLIVILVIFGILFARAYTLGSKVFVNHSSFFKKLTGLFGGGVSGTALQGESSSQINILLLGYGGEGHDGPYLTDSMILATINPDTKQVLLTSIPRDLYVTLPDGTKNKINAAFSNGYTRKNDFSEGGQEARDAVSKLTGMDIPYFVSADFSGFKQAIDKVGGVDINIERTFTDSQYPNDATNGYLPPLTFKKGFEHMDGTRALEFVRSRHGTSHEDSDFARSRRQELVLNAFKQKISGLNIGDVGTLNSLMGIFADHVHTNIDPSQIIHLRDLLSGGAQILNQSLDQDTGLICPTLLPPDPDHGAPNGIYILTNCDGVTDSQIQDFFQKGIQFAPIRGEHAAVILEDSGSNTALYKQVKQDLQGAAASVYPVPYKGIALNQSVLYEINPKPETEKYLSQKLGISAQPKPPEMKANADLVLIIGGQ